MKNPNSAYVEPLPGAHPVWLPPWDARLIFERELPAASKAGSEEVPGYPIVQWTDRWGTGWQHKRGTLCQIGKPDELTIDGRDMSDIDGAGSG